MEIGDIGIKGPEDLDRALEGMSLEEICHVLMTMCQVHGQRFFEIFIAWALEALGHSALDVEAALRSLGWVRAPEAELTSVEGLAQATFERLKLEPGDVLVVRCGTTPPRRQVQAFCRFMGEMLQTTQVAIMFIPADYDVERIPADKARALLEQLAGAAE